MHEKILIVEDDLELADMLKLYFDGRGYQAATVAFGEEAVAQARTFGPELVILDIFLPDIDGYEVCRRLRAQQRTSQIPILFLTGKRGRDAKIAGLQLGAVDYITKPFDMPELAARVDSILRRSSFRPLDHPVSGLPGEELFEERLAALRRQAGWRLTRIDLDGLDGIADAYGFLARDDILRAVAVTLQATVVERAHPANFVAHLDQAAFYMISAAPPADDLCAVLGEQLYRAIAPFYPHYDREGTPAARAHVPVISVYAGSLTSEQIAGGQPEDWLPALQGARRLLVTVP